MDFPLLYNIAVPFIQFLDPNEGLIILTLVAITIFFTLPNRELNSIYFQETLILTENKTQKEPSTEYEIEKDNKEDILTKIKKILEKAMSKIAQALKDFLNKTEEALEIGRQTLKDIFNAGKREVMDYYHLLLASLISLALNYWWRSGTPTPPPQGGFQPPTC